LHSSTEAKANFKDLAGAVDESSVTCKFADGAIRLGVFAAVEQVVPDVPDDPEQVL
jgi:hypothetical protein